MISVKQALTLGVLISVGTLTGGKLHAQDMGRHMMDHEQHHTTDIHQMRQMMDSVSSMMSRAVRISEEMATEADHSASEKKESYAVVQRMSQAMSIMAEQIKLLIQDAEYVIQSDATEADTALQKDARRFSSDVHVMAKGMEHAFRFVEREAARLEHIEPTDIPPMR